MADFLLSLPFWSLWVGICSVTALVLLPVWYVSHNRRKQRSLRSEITLWRADKLLQSSEPLSLKISELKRKPLFLRFSEAKIYYQGKKTQWEIPFSKVKSWRVFNMNAGQ
jgi:hypothetical protein